MFFFRKNYRFSIFTFLRICDFRVGKTCLVYSVHLFVCQSVHLPVRFVLHRLVDSQHLQTEFGKSHVGRTTLDVSSFWLLPTCMASPPPPFPLDIKPTRRPWRRNNQSTGSCRHQFLQQNQHTAPSLVAPSLQPSAFLPATFCSL